MFYRFQIKVFLLIIFSTVATQVYAASVDCKKADNFAEKFICSDTKTSKLDKDISILYDNLMDSNEEAGIQFSQSWPSERDACETGDCVIAALTTRRSELLAGADDFYSYDGETPYMIDSIVVGMLGKKVLYVRYFGFGKKSENFCTFRLDRDGEILTWKEMGQDTDLVLNFPVTYTQNGFVIDLYPKDKKFSTNSGGGITSLCGLNVYPPAHIILKQNKLSID